MSTTTDLVALADSWETGVGADHRRICVSQLRAAIRSLVAGGEAAAWQSTAALRSDVEEVQASHRCDMCGNTGTPNPVVGCIRCGWDEMQPIPTPEPMPADTFTDAVKRLCIAGRTTGGVAGRDAGLCEALDAVEAYLADREDEEMNLLRELREAMAPKHEAPPKDEWQMDAETMAYLCRLALAVMDAPVVHVDSNARYSLIDAAHAAGYYTGTTIRLVPEPK